MKILIVNAGSSSLKYQLIDMEQETTMAKGLIERIGIPGSRLKQTAGDKKYQLEMPMPDHIEASKQMLQALLHKEHGVLKSMDEIGAVGHRVVHGGEHIYPDRAGEIRQIVDRVEVYYHETGYLPFSESFHL